jgi:CRISPR-associated protein Csd1
MLGVDTKGKPERTKDCFAAFCNLHNEILSDLSCVYAVAVLAFINAWDPEAAADNPVLQECFEEVTAGANLVFYIDGLGYVHENDEVKHAWERYKTDSSDEYKAQCLVTVKLSRLQGCIRVSKG